MKIKQAKTLSEAFLAVRNFLWDGNGKLADVFPAQESCICFAASKARVAGAITLDQSEQIKDIIQTRLGMYLFVGAYVRNEHGAINPSCKQLQDYRHAWLIALSEEFKGRM